MKPLEGLRILSLEQFAAGPYGSMYLADMGAEVIKIENKAIGGDPSRHTGPFHLGDSDSLFFQGWNTNKRSVVLDMKSEPDRATFEQLVKTADAVVNNLRGDQPEKLGVDYKSLRHLNPKVVCLHISAYGRKNSREAWPGYDFLMQAEAGLMHLTGDPAGEPTRFGASVVDYMTGVTGMLGLLGALRRADRTGQGADVDVSLFDVALHQLGYAGTWYLNEGLVSGRVPRGAHLSITPVQTFRAADGWIYVMCMTNRFWDSLLNVLGNPELRADIRFADQSLRLANRDALTEALDTEFRKQPVEHWLKVLRGVLPIAPVLDLKQALDNPFVDEAGMVTTVPHPFKPDMKLLANPLKFDGQRLAQAPCHPLGADQEAALQTQARV
ncbi:CoA transferase [Cupriavidus necator]|uniref:CaiB/BaiF CoA transferase family protein n=1 Tax=Cupriavidus necator TaxID=106590 RepID=UPI0039C02ECF